MSQLDLLLKLAAGEDTRSFVNICACHWVGSGLIEGGCVTVN